MSRKEELIAWAKEHMRGAETVIYPSFTPDFSQLDEEGIRWDVQQSIKHKFGSALLAPSGLTPPEIMKFTEICCNEAKGKILLSIAGGYGSKEQIMGTFQFAEKVGVNHVMLMHPPSFYPKTKEEIYEVTRQICAMTKLPIVLYPTHKFNFERFHPCKYPLDILDRLVDDIDNAVAMKVAILEPGFIFEAFSRYSDKILVMCPWERWIPELVHNYGMQWFGAGNYELFQSPEKPYLSDYFDLMLKGERNRAMEIYWMLTPVREVFERQFMPTQVIGVYNAPMQKYYQWLTGGNGGYIRASQHLIYQHDMDDCKQALRAIGITPREPDEEFYVGRLNYGKMKK